MNTAGASPSNTRDAASTNSDFPGRENNVGGFTYGLGVSLGILVLITTITLASYFCTRDEGSTTGANQSEEEQQQQQQRRNDHCVIDVEGIDENTLKTYPKCLYSQLESSKKNGSTVSCCSICLADYKGKDVLRLLPECGHAFHLKCVDPWLRVHPTCPVCRTSPLPTPQSTPLAEVAPLAASRIG
ncbi:RING-H2 finger protein ATL70-like [Chenopodium quinoa]|uniref:RING-H2 finger protein ATL70-like n=1 Tax=Chenopodium quinoa TaxID=63459 RepID=UPI000B783C88|nr:RING-H2 finger protein ATL70-like [Chenopodium quinoa]